MRTQRLADHVRHWRKLLAVADTGHVSADALRKSLVGLDHAIAAGDVLAMRWRLSEVQLSGRALEEALRG